jgi:ADP-ribose pyrophosphatase YjhB (NUDIX family)
MDISFTMDHEKFNYRVCAIMTDNGKILAMHDERSPYFYLPGGRVQLGETAEHAVVREVKEELNITAEIVRPLWLNQAFFKEDINRLDYHELCIYFLMDISGTELLSRGGKFSLQEGQHQHDFEWLQFERLKDEYFYPTFLKEAIFKLPQTFTIRSERE